MRGSVVVLPLLLCVSMVLLMHCALSPPRVHRVGGEDMPHKVVTEETINEVLRDLHIKYPRLRLITKETESERCTTIGTTIAVPKDWDRMPPVQRYVRLKHEEVHLAQYKQFGLVGFFIQYVFLPMPLGFSYARYTLEREAFAEEMRAVLETVGADALKAKRDYYIHQFTSTPYYFAWPFFGQAADWVDTTIQVLLGEGR